MVNNIVKTILTASNSIWRHAAALTLCCTLLFLTMLQLSANAGDPDDKAHVVTQPEKPGSAGYTAPGTKMEFVVVPGGCFQDETTIDSGKDKKMQSQNVCVNDFSIGKNDITVGQFREFVSVTGYRTEAEAGEGCFGWNGSTLKKSTDYNWRNPGFSQADNHPVVCVSWNDATAYTHWLRKQHGRKYRLPTEAEWQFACRSGSKNEVGSCNGKDIDAVAWHSSNSDNKTHPIGQKQPNSLGIHDMCGNVWQWVSEWNGKNYSGKIQRNSNLTEISSHFLLGFRLAAPVQ